VTIVLDVSLLIAAEDDSSSLAFSSLPTRPMICRSSPMRLAVTVAVADGGKTPLARSRIWLFPFAAVSPLRMTALGWTRWVA
jgi:hypothetical protein